MLAHSAWRWGEGECGVLELREPESICPPWSLFSYMVGLMEELGQLRETGPGVWLRAVDFRERAFLFLTGVSFAG